MVTVTNPPTPTPADTTEFRLAALERQAAGPAAQLQFAEQQKLALEDRMTTLAAQVRDLDADAFCRREPQDALAQARNPGQRFNEAYLDEIEQRAEARGFSRGRAGAHHPRARAERAAHLHLVGGTRVDLDSATARTQAVINDPGASPADVERAAELEEAAFDAYLLQPGAEAELQAEAELEAGA
ncbi:MAG: hypothetical protein ACRDOU_05305 [Streptosporangiaceae bacterium]